MTTSDINIYTHTARDCGEARGLQRRRRQGDGPGRFRSSGLVYYPASILHQLYPRSMMGPDLVSPTATQCCIAHNVHFLDGVHFMHSARLPVLHHALKDLGKVRGCGRRGRAGEGKSWTRGMGSQPSKSCCRRITNDPTPFPPTPRSGESARSSPSRRTRLFSRTTSACRRPPSPWGPWVTWAGACSGGACA